MLKLGVLGILCCLKFSGDGIDRDGESTETSVTRPYHEIHAELRSLLQKEASPKSRDTWAETVVELTQLYGELMRDTRRADSGSLESYRLKLRSRLLQIQKQLEAEQKRRARHDHADAAEKQERLYASIRCLARRIPPNRLAEQPELLSLLQRGGAGGGGVGGAGGGAAGGDYGPALIELIYRTISPKFWNVNGGPGSIAYYRPWFALVVRATPEIHEKIGGALGGGARKSP